MEHTDVVKSNGRPIQATGHGQHDGEKLQVLVLSQGRAYLVCLNNMFQNGERVVRVVGNVGSSMSSRVELVVLRGQVYFQSEESLSKFMSNTAVMSYLPEDKRSGLQASECQNGCVQLIHSHVEAVFASAAELGRYVNKFSTT